MAVSENGQEILDRIDKFHKFYNDAWSKLLTMISIGVVIVGMIIPAASMVIQNRSFKKEAVTIRKELREEQQERLYKAEKTMGLTVLEVIENKMAGTEAGIFHLQALLMLTEHLYPVAATSLVAAAHRYLIAKDERNLQKVLTLLSDMCLKKLKKRDFEIAEKLKVEIELLLSELTEADTDVRYSNYIRDIKGGLNKAKKRW